MRPCSWTTITFAATACAVLSITAGCAATPAGIEGHEGFQAAAEPVVLSGPRPYAQVARCFEEQGRFLPLSEFSRDAEAAAFTYRLRVSGLWFEQVRITATHGGTQAEWRLAPNLDGRWRAQFERDRVAPLARCLAA